MSHQRHVLALAVLWVIGGSPAFSTPPILPPLGDVIEACEKRREMCAYALYYVASGKIAAKKAEKYATLGCNARDMVSCYTLGTHYLRRGDKKQAWYPLAKACFVNDGVACHDLRDNDLPLPPVMTFRPDYGPAWPSEFSALDAVFVERQREFRSCYEGRRRRDGFVEMRITIAARNPTVEILRSTMDQEFTECLTRRIKSLVFPKRESVSLQRTFQYFTIYTEGLRR